MEDSFPRPLRTPVLHQEWCFERHENHENSCFRPHIGLQDLPFKRRKTALFRNYQQLRDSGLYQNARPSIRFFRHTPDFLFHRIKPQLPAFRSTVYKTSQPASFPGHLCPFLFCPALPAIQKLLNPRASSGPPDQVSGRQFLPPK